jgi:hypothetical protein
VTVTPARPRRRPRRRRSRSFRWVAILLAIALAFLGGIGLGEALHDNPKPGGTQTVVRTLRVQPLVPVVQSTVTVTVPSR